VEELYLEDVLKLTGYMSKKMAECKQQLEKGSSLQLMFIGLSLLLPTWKSLA